MGRPRTVSGRQGIPAAEAPMVLLIAGSDRGIADCLKAELSSHDIEVIWCHDGAEALLNIGRVDPDVVLADVDLPVLGGADFVRAIRRHRQTPILVGVGEDEARAATQALAAGATACVARPYRIRELMVLLVAVTSGEGGAAVLEHGPLRMDTTAVTVHLRGRLLHLPLREFQLLHLLMSNPGRVITRKQIGDIVWKTPTIDTSNTIAVHVKRLRARLQDNPKEPQSIQAVRGVGYRFVPPAE